MCGIAGYSGRFSPTILNSLAASIAHRGPDDSGTWHDSDSGIGLAHQRLSIIDTSSAGHQPMWDFEHKVVIAFNGEIYNFIALRQMLIQKQFRFESKTDTEVLLDLYLLYGTEMLKHLNGIFAFAIWDTNKKSLFIARDGFGVKPLYYTITQHGFLFASELKALLCCDGVDKKLSSDALRFTLLYSWTPAPFTLLEKVNKLEPGHAMIVRQGSIERTWQWYSIPTNTGTNKISEDDAAAKTREMVEQAVQRQMVSDVPLGTFLSGGLDSTAISYFAKKHLGKAPLQSFTIGFKDSAFKREGFADDLPFAQKAAAHIGAELHTVMVGSEISNRFEHMVYHLDEPQADPAPINLFLICSLAKKHGIKVLLSGAGGDDIFTGYRRHYALQSEKYWSWLPQTVKNAMAIAAVNIGTKSTLRRRLSKAFRYANLDNTSRIESYFRWIEPDIATGLFADDITANGFKENSPLNTQLNLLPGNMSRLSKMLNLESKFFLADHNLNYTDKMSMATGVEVRVPFLDPDLVTFAASLPDNFKQRGKTGKFIFKKSMEGLLPNEIIYRPKTGFGAPIRSWLRNELRDYVADILGENSLRKRGIFNPDAVKRLIENDRKGSIDASYTILSLFCIELWCRLFIDTTIPKQ